MTGGMYSQGDILLAALVFSNQAGLKRRPVMVVYDSGDVDLLVSAGNQPSPAGSP